jgi:bifunctional oligoribonuclease and PAP phosphatase NrnA
MTSDSIFGAATRAVEEAGSIVLVTHVNPDGDAIGSVVGLANALRARGKIVDAVVDGGVPEYLRFLPGAETVMSVLSNGEWDLMISLDASDEARTGLAGEYGRAHSRKVINVDHHATNTMFGELQIVIPETVSTTEIVLGWLAVIGQPVTADIAQSLLCGMVTDTRAFRTSNVRASTLGEAKRLMEAGASLTEITLRALDNHPYSVIELWKSVIPRVELNNTVISATITHEDVLRAQITDGENGGLVSILLSVTQAMISVVFTELADGQVELSFRSKPGYDVAKVAFALGGGGHKQASGATINGPLDAAKGRVMPMLYEAAREGQLVIA